MGWSDQNIIAQLAIVEGPDGGFFFYNGTAELGNPPETWITSGGASAPTEDPFGNPLPTAGGTTNRIAGGAIAQLFSGALTIFTSTVAQAARYGLDGTTSGAQIISGPAGNIPLDVEGGVQINGGITVWLPPSGDTTGATDAAAINAALGAAKNVVLLPGQFYVNATIQIPAFGSLTGPGPLWIGTANLKAVNGANLAAIIASQGWTTSANAASQSPIVLRDLVIDGNKANQTSGTGHGIVSQNFGSYFEDLVIVNTVGDGLRLDAFGANGSTEISNTAVENRIYRCQFRSNNGSGIRTNDNTGNQHFTDGFAVDNIVQNPLSHGIEIMCAAGWKIDGNHLYGLPLAGIWAGRIFNTRIVNNLIETWGSSAVSGFYSGIDCGNLAAPIADAGQGSSICNNNLAFTAAPGNAGTDIDGITCTASGGASGSVTVTGNQIFNNQVSAARYRGGIVLQAQNATATLNAVTTGNQVLGGWNATVDTILNGGVVNHTTGV